jgi:hypothetical protein
MSHACWMAEWEDWSDVGRGSGSSGNRWKGLIGPIIVGVIFIAGGIICMAVGAWLNHRAQNSSQPDLNSIGPLFIERGGAVALVIGVALLACVGIVRGFRTRW